MRLRLRADFVDRCLSEGARVVARALQTYGMFLSDGGNIALTGAADRYSTAKWSNVGVTNPVSHGAQGGGLRGRRLGTEINWNTDTHASATQKVVKSCRATDLR